MKRFMLVLVSFVLLFSCFSPTTASATYSFEQDAGFTIEEFELLEHTYAEYNQTRATGLITDYSLGIAKSGNILKISGYTYGSSVVTKCGFAEVIVQRRTDSNSSWSDYLTYEDLYSSSNSYTLTKSVTVDSGYQYRVTATHFAKKSLFSTEKITGTTGLLIF